MFSYSSISINQSTSNILSFFIQLKDDGKIRFIGITGLPLRVLKEVLEQSGVKIDTVLSYCHYSLNDTSLLDYIPFFQVSQV